MALKLSCVPVHIPTLYQGEGSVKLFGDHRIDRRQFRAEKTMPMRRQIGALRPWGQVTYR